jgi:hypothetical protein
MSAWRAALVGALISSTAASAGADLVHPVFVPEAVSDFTAALRKEHGRTLDSRHSDARQYHAYRFFDPQNIVIGVARNVSLDREGHLVIEQEPGAPLGGRPNRTHQEYSHLLLPAAVRPPR